MEPALTREGTAPVGPPRLSAEKLPLVNEHDCLDAVTQVQFLEDVVMCVLTVV